MTLDAFNTNIRNDLDTIGSTIANISLHIDLLNFLYNDSTDSDKKIFYAYPLFWHLRNSYWSVSILDLHKIFSKNKNDHYSLTLFTKRLIDNYSKIDWKQYIELSKLLSIEEEINTNRTEIEKIKKIRDQHIAHLDRKRERIDLKVAELIKLLLFSQSVYCEFNLKLNYASTTWDFTWAEKGYQVLRNLDKFQKNKRTNSGISDKRY